MADTKPATKEPVSRIWGDFYNDRYSSILITSLLLILIATGLFYWIFQERAIQPEPIAFPTTHDGKLIQPVPLNLPGFTTPQIIDWAVRATNDSFSFNFIDYEKAITQATQYYTQQGFQDYRRTLIDSGIVNTVQRSKYVVSVEPTSAPVILKEALTPDNVYSWQLQFGVRITFENLRDKREQDWIITLLLVRVPLTNSTQGLGIDALIAREGRIGIS